ncbi:carboxypeptidase-like regulatory domain-containing protein, partial [Escherichia coli]|uniref:carboxypeptidase-like regulatory domain-containing protein n=1 Tax=Escherichia coli TaxID=562 RepID=UPI00237B58A8
GTLSDSNKQVYFEGAQVKIKELNLTTQTRRDGTFRFNNIEPGNYTLEISYLGATPIVKTIFIEENKTLQSEFTLTENNTVSEDIVVYG